MHHTQQGLEEIAHQLAEVHESDANCAVCGAPGDEEAMILCDGCDRGYVYRSRFRRECVLELMFHRFIRVARQCHRRVRGQSAGNRAARLDRRRTPRGPRRSTVTFSDVSAHAGVFEGAMMMMIHGSRRCVGRVCVLLTRCARESLYVLTLNVLLCVVVVVCLGHTCTA